MNSQNKLRLAMDVVATMAAVVGCGLVLYFNWSKLAPRSIPVPAAPVSLKGAAFRGNADAPVVVVEFSDYFCPFCAKAENEVLPAIQRNYIEQGKVSLAFRHHPLEQLHPGATAAAVAAVCAGTSGRFWEMHASLFGDHKDVSPASLTHRAGALSIDADEFGRCLTSADARGRVDTDVRQAEALGLGGTPVFLIGRRQPDGAVRVVSVIDGARPVGDFQAAIEKALRGDPSETNQLMAFAALSGMLLVAAWVWSKRRRVGVLTSQ